MMRTTGLPSGVATMALSATLALSRGGVAEAFNMVPVSPSKPRPSRCGAAMTQRRWDIAELRSATGKCDVRTRSGVGAEHGADGRHAAGALWGVKKEKEQAVAPLSESADPNVAATFEPSGPTVVFDDPPTEVYEKSITRTLQWVGAAVLFGLALFKFFGAGTAEEFFAGYLVEQSLSVDNLFVFLLLFDYFKVPLRAQDRVLNWGIYGAVGMRAIMIGIGAAALENFHAILLVFAAILVYSSAKVLLPGGEEEEEEDMSDNAIVKFSRTLIDSVDEFDGDRFFTFVDGIKKATPLFICMIAVEISDVVFAVDSIPAVFGVTNNALVVFTSNLFAIMGLRSLYTILSKAASDLKYLEPAVAIVLGFIGGKMIAEYFGYDIPTEIALGVVAILLSGGVGLSIYEKERTLEEGGQ